MPRLEEGPPVRCPEVSSQLEIAIEHHSRSVLVRLSGELDVATAPALDQRLQELVADGHMHLLIDLSKVEFMDSSGLGSIVRAQSAADTNGHRLSLRRGSTQVQRLFDVTGMLRRLTFED